jgi:Abnormal spindle-like microcephaly-assoc'd, ASPM-SPD-2-Hydin
MKISERRNSMSSAMRTIQAALNKRFYEEPIKFRERTRTRISLSVAAVRYLCPCLLMLMLTSLALASSTLTFSPSEADFGTVVIGETAKLAVQVTNVSGGRVAITNISVEGFSSFSVASKCPAEIPAGASCPIEVSFHPVSGAGYHGKQTAVIVFYDGTTVLASLHANGQAF